ncbi:unnamed protein product [Bursaphelenchus xylophilus]|uniref:(pine wood nematode) hypothetical protein n=1 Tax=Bursaphelenchus xylophilus TaxID=6326 RepID=A0A7I8WKP5_BURXY|nr:unnamed protein product [Bursaphelenchus xylophilus]CAG9106508.1 unnamed protein product [Bursaphelenchus xylophilus]
MGNSESSHGKNKQNQRPPMFDTAVKAFARVSSDGNVITKEDLTTHFGNHLGAILYRFFDQKPVDQQCFAEKFYNLYEMRAQDFVENSESIEEFCEAVLETVGKSRNDEQNNFISSFCDDARSSPTQYIEGNSPGLVHTCLLGKLRNGVSPLPENIVFASESELLSPFQMLVLQGSLPEMVYFQNKRPTGVDMPCWHILYDSGNHGLSVNGFEGKVFGYQSPTVAIFKMNDGQIFVIANNLEWRHTTKNFGSSFTKCLRISPTFKVFESRSPEPIFCNFKYRTSGFGVGYKDAFTVNAGFDNVAAIEVWGCGDDAALKAQAAQKLRQRMAAERNQKVPLPGNWDDNPDKTVLEMAGFQFSSERNRPEPPIDE